MYRQYLTHIISRIGLELQNLYFYLTFITQTQGNENNLAIRMRFYKYLSQNVSCYPTVLNLSHIMKNYGLLPQQKANEHYNCRNPAYDPMWALLLFWE